MDKARKGFIASAAGLTGLRGAVLAASTPFLLAAVAVTAFGKSLQIFAEFERTLNVFAATTGATAEEMERVSEASRQLGADLTLPAVNASDAASAMTELAKAGLSVEDALAGARGVLQLSTAAQISTGDAAQYRSQPAERLRAGGRPGHPRGGRSRELGQLRAGLHLRLRAGLPPVGCCRSASGAVARGHCRPAGDSRPCRASGIGCRHVSAGSASSSHQSDQGSSGDHPGARHPDQGLAGEPAPGRVRAVRGGHPQSSLLP